MTARARKVAVVHEWFETVAGSERVVEQILRCYPEADVYCIVDFLSESDRRLLSGRRVRTSFIQRLPFARRCFRHYLPLMPFAVEQFDLSAYDIVISSTHAVAKGVLTGPDQLHLAYVHSPMRYAWDMQHQYLRESNLVWGIRSVFARAILHAMRTWDYRTSCGVDVFIANSAHVARRVRKCYGREAMVIPPPVDTDTFALRDRKEDFYVTVSRAVPYKRLDLLVEAFSRMPARRLLVLGRDTNSASLRSQAGSNVELLGHQPIDVVRDFLQRARAFVYAAEEDFGIAVLEAQACGTPVIAYGKGGVRETVRATPAERSTGVLYEEQSVDAVVAAVDRFERESGRFDPSACRANAERFTQSRFRSDFEAAVEAAWLELRARERHDGARPGRADAVRYGRGYGV